MTIRKKIERTSCIPRVAVPAQSRRWLPYDALIRKRLCMRLLGMDYRFGTCDWRQAGQAHFLIPTRNGYLQQSERFGLEQMRVVRDSGRREPVEANRIYQKPVAARLLNNSQIATLAARLARSWVVSSALPLRQP